jgi:putative transposase
MKAKEFQQLYDARGLTKAARAQIEAAREKPSRTTRGAAGNVTGVYPSRKNGVTIRFESHKVELPCIVEMEHRAVVIAYFDQPTPIKLTYLLPNGRNYSTYHTPDFLKIERDRIAFVECKDEAQLEKLSVSMPNRYVRTPDGAWHCPPGQQAAAAFGFEYEVWSTTRINWELHDNLTYLDDYFRRPVKRVHDEVVLEPLVANPDVAELAFNLVSEEQGIALEQLCKRIEAQVGAELPLGEVMDTLNILLVQTRLFVDLYRERLSIPKYAHVYTDQATCEAYSLLSAPSTSPVVTRASILDLEHGETVLWGGDPWTIVGITDAEITMLAGDQLRPLDIKSFNALLDKKFIVPQGNSVDKSTRLTPEGQERLRRASPRHKEIATRRYKGIVHKLLGQERAPNAPVFTRSTIFELVRAYRLAERLYGYGYIGLLPKYANCGKHTKRLPDDVMELVEEYAKQYEVPERPTKRSIHRKLKAACTAQELAAPSYQFFSAYLDMRPRFELEKRRRGRRGAYKFAIRYWDLEFTTPRHGSRPFEIAHIDHTIADIIVVTADGKTEIVGRVSVSFLVDAFSRRILAVWCSLDPVSTTADMMLIRECVRRWHRLPQIIVSDRGPDFGSVYYETLLARYEVLKKERPTARPRVGSVIERLFGTADTQFFHLLRGNTQNLRNPRELSPEVDPEKRALWSIGPLYIALCWWAYEVYDQAYHEGLQDSPRNAFNTSISLTGHRGHKHIPYDVDFVYDTLPTTRKGTAKVTESGVKINRILYWHEDMQRAEVMATSVPVRWDPFDAGVAYAYILDRWVQCFSRHYAQYRGRSAKEVQEATRILREKYRTQGLSIDLSDRQVADFLVSLEAAEALQEQRMRDREQQAVFKALNSMAAGGETYDYQAALHTAASEGAYLHAPSAPSAPSATQLLLGRAYADNGVVGVGSALTPSLASSSAKQGKVADAVWDSLPDLGDF